MVGWVATVVAFPQTKGKTKGKSFTTVFVSKLTQENLRADGWLVNG